MLPMKRAITIIGFLLYLFIPFQPSLGDTTYYKPQPLFGSGDSGVFHDLQSDQLLKPILDANRTLYMEQDGDIFEEDIATIDDNNLHLLSRKYSFSKSKRILATQIYHDHRLAFYSGCTFRLVNKKYVPIHSSCGFKHRKNKKRSQRIEWEHVVPAWHFGHQLQCWQNGGRLHCRNNNETFRQMEADMHNLVPAIGEINGDRSNYKYQRISGETRPYGQSVNVEIAFSSRVAEPPEQVFGDIARTYFYMMDKYGLKVSDQQRQLLIVWNNADPVDSWELKKNIRIKTVQGDENSYVTHYQKYALDSFTRSSKPEATAPSNTMDDLDSITAQLKEKFGFLFTYLPFQIAEGILFLLGVYLLWRYRKNKEKENTEPDINTQQSKQTDTSTTKTKKTTQQPMESDGFLIKTILTNSVLTVSEDDDIIIHKKHRSKTKQQASQHWQLKKTNQREGFVFIKHTASQRVLEVKDASTRDGAKIVLAQQKRRLNDHQEWQLIESNTNSDHKNISYFLKNRKTGNVLDIRYKKKEDGTKVVNYHQKVRGTENQLWLIPDLQSIK